MILKKLAYPVFLRMESKLYTNFIKKLGSCIAYKWDFQCYKILGWRSTSIFKLLLPLLRAKLFTPDTFDMQNYPWVFDKNSKNDIHLQLGIGTILRSQIHDLDKLILFKEDTNNLIEIIKKALKESFQSKKDKSSMDTMKIN
mgnify:CR=1 FL=1